MSDRLLQHELICSYSLRYCPHACRKDLKRIKEQEAFGDLVQELPIAEYTEVMRQYSIAKEYHFKAVQSVDIVWRALLCKDPSFEIPAMVTLLDEAVSSERTALASYTYALTFVHDSSIILHSYAAFVEDVQGNLSAAGELRDRADKIDAFEQLRREENPQARTAMDIWVFGIQNRFGTLHAGLDSLFPHRQSRSKMPVDDLENTLQSVDMGLLADDIVAIAKNFEEPENPGFVDLHEIVKALEEHAEHSLLLDKVPKHLFEIQLTDYERENAAQSRLLMMKLQLASVLMLGIVVGLYFIFSSFLGHAQQTMYDISDVGACLSATQVILQSVRRMHAVAIFGGVAPDQPEAPAFSEGWLEARRMGITSLEQMQTAFSRATRNHGRESAGRIWNFLHDLSPNLMVCQQSRDCEQKCCIACCWPWQVRAPVPDEDQGHVVFVMRSVSLLDAMSMLSHSAQVCFVRCFSRRHLLCLPPF